MNYFLTKPVSRVLTLVLAACMMVSMLSGCMRKKPEETTPTTEASNLPSGLVEVKPTTEETLPPETDPLYDNIATVSYDVDQLEVKSSPSSTAKTLGFLDPGTEVEIIKTEVYLGMDWALIREGWVLLDYLDTGAEKDDPNDTPDETTPEETTPQNTTSIKGTITSNGLNIRKEPNTTSMIVGHYAKGASVTILEVKGNWGRTDKGWISMQYVNTGNANTNTTPNNNTTNTTPDGATYFITASELNIRDSASTAGRQVGVYNKGDKVVITETSNGWGKTDKGWISMQYAYKPGTTGENTCKGIVTGSGVNIRTGPGTGYGTNGAANYGKRVEILEQITIGDTTWGCTADGWISMGFVYVDGTENDTAATGTVIGDTLNIRSGPGTKYASVGSLKEGDTVRILAQFEIEGTYWGCTTKGWVSMDYVAVG